MARITISVSNRLARDDVEWPHVTMLIVAGTARLGRRAMAKLVLDRLGTALVERVLLRLHCVNRTSRCNLPVGACVARYSGGTRLLSFGLWPPMYRLRWSKREPAAVAYPCVSTAAVHCG